MTTTDDLVREMEQDATAERGKLVDLIAPLAVARAQIKPLKAIDDASSPALKQWMTLHDAELDRDTKGFPELRDNERGARAWLTTSHPAEWDIRKAPDSIILELAHAGLLDVKNTAYNERRKSAPATYLDDAVKYRHDGDSVSLHVEVFER